MQRGSSRNRLLDFAVGVPLLNGLATLHRRRRPPSEQRRIGVMSSPALGDTLLFSAPLQDLRATFPSARITHICMKQNLAAAEIIPGADDRLLVSLTRPVEAIRLLREAQLDVLLDFTAWQRITALYALLSGARYTAGFRTSGQYRSRGYDTTVEHRRDRHELDNFRALLGGCGLVSPEAVGHEPAVTLPEPNPPEPFAGEADIVAMHLWAAGQRSHLREWPEERWVELAERLAGRNTLFVITGAPSDGPRVRPFVELLRGAGLRAEAFVSPDGFISLTRLLLRARLVVSVNTGIMHLAAVAGARTVSLNGPTAVNRWGGHGRCVVNVQPEDRSGGYLHLGFEFAGQPEDVMQRITVEQVAVACSELMAACPIEPGVEVGT
jgi:heptosyltransferase III